ncbi:MAG: TlyA family RNA methyltransferase [Candidatus Paceibacterota bacterium]
MFTDFGKANNKREPQNEKHIRLDRVLVDRGLVKSRERAKELINSGKVLVGDKQVLRASFKCPVDVDIKTSGSDIPWVSRAGSKLDKALNVWPIKVAGCVCLDIGASTGGFTEVLLKAGAEKVYALDVSEDQLDKGLQRHRKVVVVDGLNIRDVDSDTFSEKFDIVTVDVSFISLEYVLPKLSFLLKKNGEAVVLVKPQFEVGKKRIGKGIVRDPVLHQEVVAKVKTKAKEEGFYPLDHTESPIKGAKGNKEFLLYLRPRSSA